MDKVATISLFAGAGGMDLGAEAAGAHVVYANELADDACATLRRCLPEAEIDHRDIREVAAFPKADLVIGGYPCQSFSLGGNRNPEADARTLLYLQFARCLETVQPKFFVAENVSGLKKLQQGRFLQQQVAAFERVGKHGYRISAQVLDAKEYGIPQSRKRMFIVGVRRDLAKAFTFPRATRGKATRKSPLLKPFESHGEAIKHLPLWPEGEFYERPHDPEGNFAWYYMSRNRKAPWDGPAFTVVANWRHITLHPACPKMKLLWSNLADGWKQRWEFSNEYEHAVDHPERPVLERPRRLSWRECALIQTFSEGFEPFGDVESKFEQIGNAVPPRLAEAVIGHLVSGEGLVSWRAKPAHDTKLQQLMIWE